MASIQEKQLGQLRPANTTAASLYSPAASTTAIIKAITVSNTSGGAVTFRIFMDDDGTTFDETTALFWDIALAANTTTQIDTYYAMNNSAGALGVRTSSNNAITFTCFGAEIS